MFTFKQVNSFRDSVYETSTVLKHHFLSCRVIEALDADEKEGMINMVNKLATKILHFGTSVIDEINLQHFHTVEDGNYQYYKELLKVLFEIPALAERNRSTFSSYEMTFMDEGLELYKIYGKDSEQRVSHRSRYWAFRPIKTVIEGTSLISKVIIDNVESSDRYKQYVEECVKRNEMSLSENRWLHQATVVPSINSDVPSINSDVKLQWNAPNRALYDLFAHLTLVDAKPGKRLVGNTIKDLARFLANHVEGLPSVATIERELEKMREPQGVEKAKRGSIELDIRRDID